MTDDEIRDIGHKFIAQRRLYPPFAPEAEAEFAKFHMLWDYIDPLRLGVYVLAKHATGVWSIDFDHIAHVCTNPSAFAVKPPVDSARISDPVDTLADGTPLDAFKAPELL